MQPQINSLDDSYQRLVPDLAIAKKATSELRADIETVKRVAMESAASPLFSMSTRAMACEFEVLLNQNQYPTGPDHAFAALEQIGYIEQLLSVYKPTSELSNLNRYGFERPVPLTRQTLEFLQLAHCLGVLTDGAFDITAGRLSDLWGFSRRGGAVPPKEKIEQALLDVSCENILLDETERTGQLKTNGTSVNPGGIGKGYALDVVARFLLQAGIGDFIVHGGLSSIVTRGDRGTLHANSPWPVCLKHPLRSEEPLGTIYLHNQALGTSGSGKQFFHFGGKRYSHLIDPRTGWPAQGMLSVTVVCPSGAIADALATAFFVAGKDFAREFCKRHPSIGCVLVYGSEKLHRPIVETVNLSDTLWIPADTSLGVPSESEDGSGVS